MLKLTLLALSLLALVAATPVAAGDTDNPDITDECAEGHITTLPPAGTKVSHVLPWLDLEAGWISMSEDGSTLLVSLRTCDGLPVGNPQNLAEAYYIVAWNNGDCLQYVTLHDHTADGVRVNGLYEQIRATIRQADCGTNVTLTLDNNLVSRDGNTITWSIPLDGSLAPVTTSLVPTDEEPVVLERPRAVSRYHLALQSHVEADSTPEGRTVTLTD